MRKRYFILLLAVLMCTLFVILGQVTMANGFLGESEPNNTRTTADGPVIDVNTTIVGQLTSFTDQDWYQILCVAGSPITFNLKGSDRYVTGRVYDQNGNTLLTQINWQEINTYTPSYTGYLYVQMTGYQGIVYVLELTGTPMFYESEINDSQSAADGPINWGDTIVGQLDYRSGEQDWYQVYCLQGYPITFNLDASDHYVTGRVYNQTGDFLTQINWRETNQFYPSYTGIMYIQMTGYAGIGYALKVAP